LTSANRAQAGAPSTPRTTVANRLQTSACAQRAL
jgi:hypothetical protein